MIWKNYVFRRGIQVEDLWDQMFESRRRVKRPMRLLYIAGRGFDVRAVVVMRRFLDRLIASACDISDAKLLLVGFSGYQMSSELHEQTSKNANELENIFSRVGGSETIRVGRSAEGEDDISATMALRRGADQVLGRVSDLTDVVLDVSSLPRIAYLTFLLALLAKIIPHGDSGDGLAARGLTLHVLVGEDAHLDGQISSEDPSNDLVLIPGYAAAMQSEALRDIPMVWFPILGENRVPHIEKVELSIPTDAEICPILPHPSRNPRRGDELLAAYDSVLFARRETPLSNIVYAHEAHPFEAYRQLLGAMMRYRKTMSVIGGCRLVVTPLGNKLITVGAALACYEMRLLSADRMSSVAIPYAEPTRYVAGLASLLASRPEVSALVLTGDPFA